MTAFFVLALTWFLGMFVVAYLLGMIHQDEDLLRLGDSVATILGWPIILPVFTVCYLVIHCYRKGAQR